MDTATRPRTEAERLAEWIERFKERDPQGDEDYGYNHAVDDIVREVRTPTVGSEMAPIFGSCDVCGGFLRVSSPDRPPAPPPRTCSSTCREEWVRTHPREYA